MIKREPARLRPGARADETRTEAVNPLHRQTRDDNVNHAYYTPSGLPLVAESHTLKSPACSNYFQLFTNRRRAKRKLMIMKSAATPSCNQLSLNGR